MKRSPSQQALGTGQRTMKARESKKSNALKANLKVQRKTRLDIPVSGFFQKWNHIKELFTINVNTWCGKSFLVFTLKMGDLCWITTSFLASETKTGNVNKNDCIVSIRVVHQIQRGKQELLHTLNWRCQQWTVEWKWIWPSKWVDIAWANVTNKFEILFLFTCGRCFEKRADLKI